MTESEGSEGLNMIPMGIPLPTLHGTCKNCGASISGNFCSACGQRTSVKRINWRDGWNDFWSRVYGFDGMFPRTLRDLTIRPGQATREYINGNRVKYYGPVGYFFLMITVFLLILSLINLSFKDFMMSMQATSQQTEGQQKVAQMFSSWISENMRIFSFAIIPFISLSAMLFFRKSKLNFLEHAVLPLYLNGHIYWFSTISAIVFKISGIYSLNWVGSILTFVLFGMGYMQLMNYQSPVKAFIKGVFTYFLGFLLFLLLFTILGIVYVLSDPEMLELMRPKN